MTTCPNCGKTLPTHIRYCPYCGAAVQPQLAPQRRFWGWALVLLAIALLGGGMLLASSGGEGRIAFSSTRDGNDEIYVMNADGSGQTNLTNHPATDDYPSWSQDGTRIVFSSSVRDDYLGEIYIMNADGSGVIRLTDNPTSSVWAPCWSPDVTRIAFVSYRDVGDTEIYAMNTDGSGITNLTDYPTLDDYPSWSPDGTRIAFTSMRDEPDPQNCGMNCNFEIYVMSANGTGVTRLTNNPGVDSNPSWSPDGTRIAFESNYEIYMMNADGTGVTKLTKGRFPAWSR